MSDKKQEKAEARSVEILSEFKDLAEEYQELADLTSNSFKKTSGYVLGIANEKDDSILRAGCGNALLIEYLKKEMVKFVDDDSNKEEEDDKEEAQHQALNSMKKITELMEKLMSKE